MPVPAAGSMKIGNTYVRSETESLYDVKAYLQGRVFHVTRLKYLPEIKKCGEIRTNSDGALPTTFVFLKNGIFPQPQLCIPF
jgi:hypothetical protein